jgi:hypothetical protein
MDKGKNFRMALRDDVTVKMFDGVSIPANNDEVSEKPIEKAAFRMQNRMPEKAMKKARTI